MRLDKLPRVDEAFYRHISRNDAPTCVEGSRDGLLEKIKSWSTAESSSSQPIFWLTGIAGTGKSTVAQTVCQKAADTKNLGATFFFSHQEKQLHLANAVFSTLVHQMLSNASCPRSIRLNLNQALEQNPSAGSEVIKTQFEKLILEPLKTISHASPLLLVLDALDECTESGVVEILNLIKTHIQELPSFLKIFVTSRPEGHISAILRNMYRDSAKTERLVFIYEIDPSADEEAVQAYLTHALSESEIKRVFPGIVEWKIDADKIGILARKSEGLFIVASTIVKHIMLPGSADPEFQLDTLIEGLQSTTHTHSAINLLYQQILDAKYSPGEDARILERFRKVVGSIILLFEPPSVESLGQLLQEPSKNTVPSALHRLQSVVAVTEADQLLRSLHPSFTEFLTNRDVCPPRFYVDTEAQHSLLARCCCNTMIRLFKDPRPISDINITPEIDYALCFWDDHLVASSADNREEFLEFLRNFLKNNVAKWLSALARAKRFNQAIPSIKSAHSWVVSGVELHL